jgi:hypothetical protein
MFGRFICMSFLNTGKCDNPSCTLRHVNDITSMDGTKKVTKPTGKKESEEVKKAVSEWEVVEKKTKEDKTLTLMASKMVEEGMTSGVKVRPGVIAKKEKEMAKKKE